MQRIKKIKDKTKYNFEFFGYAIVSVIILILYFSQTSHIQYKRVTEKIIQDENLSVETRFCPFEDCLIQLLEKIKKYKEGVCGFYNIEKDLLQLLNNISKNLTLYIYYQKKFQNFNINFSNITIKFVKYNTGLMHAKFCVFNNLTIIQSLNPTYENSYLYINDQIFFYSEKLAKEFRKIIEYVILEKKPFEIKVMSKDTKMIITNYDFEDRILGLIENSEKVWFSFYLLTLKSIANALNKIDYTGIISKYKNNYAIWPPKSKRINHTILDIHTKYIANASTLITGSANPTKSANKINFEIAVIINNKEIAKKYIQFTEKLFNTNNENFNVIFQNQEINLKIKKTSKESNFELTTSKPILWCEYQNRRYCHYKEYTELLEKCLIVCILENENKKECQINLTLKYPKSNTIYINGWQELMIS